MEKIIKAFNYFDIKKSWFIEKFWLNDSLLKIEQNRLMCAINHSFIDKLKNIDNNKGLDENLEIFTKLIYEDYIKIFKNDQKIIFSLIIVI